MWSKYQATEAVKVCFVCGLGEYEDFVDASFTACDWLMLVETAGHQRQSCIRNTKCPLQGMHALLSSRSAFRSL